MQILSSVLILQLLGLGLADAKNHPTTISGHNNHQPGGYLAGVSLENKTLAKPQGNNNNNYSIISNKVLKVPGLYDEHEYPWITPLQGQANFERLIYYSPPAASSSNGSSSEGDKEPTSISLIQYYMATCPDCQGFSPYFKRFVSDIGPHWRHLVRIYTINCNDEININLCWQQNPNLIVPLLRWYTFSRILHDSKYRGPGERLFDKYPADLLNVAHRTYIKKQRRDLISLRHATLRFIESSLEQLSSTNKSHASEFYSRLPIRFKLLRPLGARRDDQTVRTFMEELTGRGRECSKSLMSTNKTPNQTIENFIVFEKPGSYVGKTFAADWSNWTCATNGAHDRLFLFHYVDNLSLLSGLKIADENEVRSPSGQGKVVTIDLKDAHNRQPLLLSVETFDSRAVQLDQVEFRLLASNHSTSGARLKRHSSAITNKRSADQQYNAHLSREKYYSSRKFRNPLAKKSPIAAPNIIKKRLRRSSNTTTKIINFNEAENINWGPEFIYPGEESIRYRFNQIVALKINKTGAHIHINQIPGANFRGENPGEIVRSKETNNNNGLIDPKEDDLTLLKLTDYYKVLDEIIHKNILSRAEVDGYQLVTSTCFVRHLSRQFPFQGQQGGQQKSISRHYLEILYQRFSELLMKKGSKAFHGCTGDLLSEQRAELERIKVSSKELQEIQNQTRKEFDIGLPSEKHFKWQYCAGSSEYLRGHTCSLWILFHTLTVHEYLNRDQKAMIPRMNCTMRNVNNDDDNGQQQYRFMIKYSEDKNKCDPANPEPALVGAKTSELFEGPMHFVLPNIINFVRYYLSCTNCAAHFSCMVRNSPGLELCNPSSPDDHILWLWEAHNRVNVRTKSTHSEDPVRPKHVFPVYEACPECYLEQPSNQTSFEQMKFNRKSLVEFIVARYRKSAILNNKIKIEDLFRKPTVQSRADQQSKPDETVLSSRLSHRLTGLVM